MKKLLCVLLSTIILFSCISIINTSAVDITNTETSASNTISFDLSSTTWNDSTYVSFHIWEYGNDPFYAWGSKKERGKDNNGDGIWTYDLDAAGITIKSSKQYCVIFYNQNYLNTYDLLFDSSCLNDTAYCTGTEYEDPYDSNKKGLAAYWKSVDKAVCGPVLYISSIGNVVGECLPEYETRQGLFESFLRYTLDNARTFTGKNDQTLIDDTAMALGINKSNVNDAIQNTGVRVSWNPINSNLNGGYVLNFDSSNTGWGNVSSINCHIWEYDGNEIYAYGSKKEQCVLNNDGTWTYDLETNSVELGRNKLYCVVFYNNAVKSTYSLLFDSTCLGDTAYCDGTSAYPNDTTKANLNTYWTKQKVDEFGPELNITNEGKIIGKCVPSTTSKIAILSKYIKDGRLVSTVEATGKTQQKALDSVASKLNLYKEEVSNAITMSETTVSWKISKSTLPSLYDVTEPTTPTTILGDVDGDDDVSVMDATTIQRHLAQLSNNIFIADAADADKDGNISVMDATQIQRFLAQLIPEL